MKHSRRKVLIITQQTVDRILIEEALDQHYQTVTMNEPENQSQVMEAYSSHDPDMIILDTALENFDSYSLCHELTHNATSRSTSLCHKPIGNTTACPIPVILLEKDIENAADAEKGLSAGAVDIIRKPLFPSIILNRVRSYLKLNHQTELLEHIALNDQATGLYNRRAFDLFIEREFQGAIRRNDDISLLLVEINDFNQHKTTFGEAAAAHCIERVAEILASLLQRTSDVVALYSRDKFALILPDTDLPGAECVGKLVLDEVKEAGISFSDTDHEVPLSLSIGSISVTANGALSALKLLDLAKKSLKVVHSENKKPSYYASLN